MSAAAAARMGSLRECVIVAAARTPIGSLGSSLAALTAPQLGAVAVRGALARVGGDAAAAAAAGPRFHVGEVVMGNVVSANVGQAPARQAAKGAAAAGARELDDSTACFTVNKVCASGLKAASLAFQSVALGAHEVSVAGGMESMSGAPYYLAADKVRFGGLRLGHGQLLDAITRDGLTDPYNDVLMGFCAEKTAKELGISRADQDAYALESYRRTKAAHDAGIFAEEIVPVAPPGGKRGKDKAPAAPVSVDEEFTRADLAKVASLKPAFLPAEQGGSVTVANSSKINDGAAALVLMSADKARALGLRPLARVLAAGDAECAPMDFSLAPELAVRVALARAGMALTDVDYHEVNEAFAVVALTTQRKLGIAAGRLNAHGGAVALGHPIGCSGARILVSLLSVLRHKKASVGVASICNGGGGATAMIIERLE